MHVIHLQFCKMRDAGVVPGDPSHLVAPDVCHTHSSLLQNKVIFKIVMDPLLFPKSFIRKLRGRR